MEDIDRYEGLTEYDTRRTCHIFGLRETLHCRHRNLVTKAETKAEEDLRADIPSFRRVDFQGVE